MIGISLGAYHVGRCGVGGVAVSVAMLGIAAARADDSAGEINGWTVTPTDESASVTTPATLSDPTDSLGLGTAPIAGQWDSVNAPFSSVGTNDLFVTPDQLGTSGDLQIENNWLFGLDEASVHTGLTNSVVAFLVPVGGADQEVDLLNITRGDAPPLFNPDATGPIDIGGVELADPQGGALLNDLFDAVFKGDTADWSNATTLIDDLFGIDSSGASDAVDISSAAVDISSVLPDLGL